RIPHHARRALAEPYKHLLGRTLALGLRVNSFEFPAGSPPPTPARRYIDAFLDRYAGDVHGRCVEFAPSYYRNRLLVGGRITSYDVWDTHPGPGVTIVADLQDASSLPDGRFDTIVCTHVLCSLPRPWQAVAEMYRLLADGGLLLCTNPVVL